MLKQLGSAPASSTDAATKGYVDTLAATSVHLSGNESINGVKTFNSVLQVAGGLNMLGHSMSNLDSFTDDNNNLIVDFLAASGAVVNYVAVGNSASNSPPFIAANGSDTNIDLNLVGQGTGIVRANGVPVVDTTSAQVISGKTLAAPLLANYQELGYYIGTVTTSATINLVNGTVQAATLTASTACTFTLPTAIVGKSFTLYLYQAATTGSGTATFSGVKWPKGTAPVMTSTTSATDIYSFVSDGLAWYGSFVQGY